ncbi:MAG TPA: four helix bundle protein [Pyrinomonadaceae bacterium]|nr:four helix bundle protein [Pyrinomonadaceae bacterium]
MRDFRQLKVWEKAHALTLAVYRATLAFPREELYGLTTQMRRSCSAIPTNIAEGCGRGSSADMARFLFIALGSASQLEYQLLLARDLKLLNPELYEQLTNGTIEIKKMLATLVGKLKADG